MGGGRLIGCLRRCSRSSHSSPLRAVRLSPLPPPFGSDLTSGRHFHSSASSSALLFYPLRLMVRVFVSRLCSVRRSASGQTADQGDRSGGRQRPPSFCVAYLAIGCDRVLDRSGPCTGLAVARCQR